MYLPRATLVEWLCVVWPSALAVSDPRRNDEMMPCFDDEEADDDDSSGEAVGDVEEGCRTLREGTISERRAAAAAVDVDAVERAERAERANVVVAVRSDIVGDAVVGTGQKTNNAICDSGLVPL